MRHHYYCSKPWGQPNFQGTVHTTVRSVHVGIASLLYSKLLQGQVQASVRLRETCLIAFK
jgi:hypothetical protein